MIQMATILCESKGCYKISQTVIYHKRKGRKIRMFVCIDHYQRPPEFKQLGLFPVLGKNQEGLGKG